MAEEKKQAAIRFSTPEIDGRYLQLPGVLPFLQIVASIKPFLSVYKVPTPDTSQLGEDAVIYHPVCTGICGTDIDLVRLRKGAYAISDVPNVPPEKTGPIFKALNVFGRLLGWGPTDRRTLRSFTLGHEIVSLNSNGQLGVIYPLFSCFSKFSPDQYCRNCQNGLEHLCLRIQEGPIRGISFGTGAVTQNGIPLGGGLQETLVGFEHHFISVDEAWLKERDLEETLKTLVMADAYACGVNGVEMITPQAMDKDTQILIIGMGAIGFSVMDYLKQNGFTNIVVLTKYSQQSELVKEYGFTPVGITANNHAETLIEISGGKWENVGLNKWVRGGFPVVFECVGSEKSISDAFLFTRENGQMVALGLPKQSYFDWYIPGRKQINAHFPFWASRGHFEIALGHLQKIPEICSRIVNISHSLSDKDGVMDAFFPKKRGVYVKNAVLIRPLDEIKRKLS
ncbi:MAG: zinc-binding dehydrogenase [Anaerolineaceae bacterium]|nr:zinc-binding dehydrogenase [Anaerolineaceae bacterium]